MTELFRFSDGEVKFAVGRHRDLSRRATLAGVVAVSFSSLWIRAGIPIYAIGGAAFDDLLFVRIAHFLLHRQWLGPYNNLTLAKGMFYSAFLAGAFLLSIPLHIAEQGVYFAACGLAGYVIWKGTGKRYWALIAFASLAMNPALWSIELARVIREGLYVSLSLVVVMLLMVACFPSMRKRPAALWPNLALGVILGGVIGAYWLTREEGIWLAPSATIIVVVSVLERWVAHRQGAVGRNNQDWFAAISLPLATMASLALCLGTVAGLNYKYYSVLQLNEIKSRNFERAYGAFTRIRHEHWRRLVLVPADAREKAYRASPAALELKGALEGEVGQAWKQVGCSSRPDIQPCSDIVGGWFMWALRDAVAKTGHYRTAKEADAYYARLAQEINHACDIGTMGCLPPRASLDPPFRREYIGETFRSAARVAKVIANFGAGTIGTRHSYGPPELVVKFAELTGELSPFDDGSLGEVNGWVATQGGMPSFEVVDHGGKGYFSSVSVLPAGDVEAVYPDLAAERFRLESTCPLSECDLIVTGGGRRMTIPFSAIHAGPVFSEPGLRMYIDRATIDEKTDSVVERRRKLQVRVGNEIASVYASLSPLLTVLASLGLFIAMSLLRQRDSLAIVALCVASLAAVCTRIFMLAYIDATSFWSANLLYASPATPFLIVYIVCGIYLGLSARRKRTANLQ